MISEHLSLSQFYDGRMWAHFHGLIEFSNWEEFVNRTAVWKLGFPIQGTVSLSWFGLGERPGIFSRG